MATQINLKFQDNFFDLAKDYADSRRYMSIQEFIREAVRKKIFDNLEIRDEYKKVLDSKEANTFSSIEDSKKFMNKLRKRAKLKKNERI
ncbi:MAG: hypothetical protein ACOC16_01145 [Nanoarchaeota archaeon]